MRCAEPAGATPARCAVICHPHPLFGGTMDNKVVTTLARTVAQRGAGTIRFNFRGVGASGGQHSNGIGETDDALAVVDWATNRWPSAPIWLCGFSFGAYVALVVASQRCTDRLVTVAPPVGRMNLESLTVPRCPWLIVQGSEDEVVDAREVLAWAQRLSPPPRVVVLPGVTHFFHGRLADLAETVATFLD